MRMCIECGKEIKSSVPYKMLALEKPYKNIFLHLDCYNELMERVIDWKGLELYLANNLEVWYNKGE